MKVKGRGFKTAAARWAGIGPYYAMFPVEFADKVIKRYTQKGDAVIDPFSGRGTAIFSAAVHGRIGIGVEINPVGWVYARAKLRPASQSAVVKRLERLARIAPRYRRSAKALPPFFKRCYSLRVRQFLLAARANLNWRRSAVDWTTMALLLVYLHGKRDASLSNQMRQTKSMSPQYAIRWWKQRRLFPPNINPVNFMKKRLKWRYDKGRPKVQKSQVFLGNSIQCLPRLQRVLPMLGVSKARLLFTSPPYLGITNYHYDQWLRLWLLGGMPNARRVGGKFRGKFEHLEKYKALLLDVFNKASCTLADDGIVYVRTDARKETLAATIDILRTVFFDKRIIKRTRPFRRPTQTRLFGDHEAKVGEVDLIMLPRRAEYTGSAVGLKSVAL